MNENNKPLLDKIKNNKTIAKIKGIKNIEIILAIVLCIIAVGAYLIIDASKKNKEIEADNTSTSGLEAILEKIEGVGKTKVLITYGTEGENVLGQEDSTMVLTPESGNSSYWGIKNSLTSSESKNAKIIGILVVCEGANEPSVQAKVLNAIQVATGVTVNKIRIFAMK